MGLYSQYIFPRICDWTLGQPHVAKHRRELLASAQGDVLEIGFGTGLNLPHYPAAVRKITTVEPNPAMNQRARQRIRECGIPIEQRVSSGEDMPLGSDRFDCVISTFTLCSVRDVGRVMSKVLRVLKPGGSFLFLEHGLSAEPGVRKWQHRLNRLQMWLGQGCRLDRNMKALVGTIPFTSLDVNEFYLEQTPRTHGYLFRGIARK
ncbi:MAG: class I SAM-dependent methyltransferase [Gemmataceae bacterium]